MVCRFNTIFPIVRTLSITLLVAAQGVNLTFLKCVGAGMVKIVEKLPHLRPRLQQIHHQQQRQPAVVLLNGVVVTVAAVVTV